MAVITKSSRESDIAGASYAHAPSYDGVEIWTTAEGIIIAGKPLDEHLHIARARREYDVATQTYNTYGRMRVAGIMYAGEDPRTFAEKVSASGAPIRSIVNAWNLARLARGQATARIYETDRQAILDMHESGGLVDFLEARSG